MSPSAEAYFRLWENAMAPLAGVDDGDAIEVQVEISGDSIPGMDGDALIIPSDDGGVIVQFPGAYSGPDEGERVEDHDDNLADRIPEGELGRIADNLIQAIEQDDKDRGEWLTTRAKGIDLLALKIEPPRGDTGTSSGPMEGMSSVRNPLLLEAVLRFQANARGELLPSNGPVKCRVDGPETTQTDAEADALEQDMNTYLTVTAPEYYPDTDRLLFSVGFGGCGFKKVYHCPLRRRPVSESVDAKDLIVPSTATDLRNSGRITHMIPMRPSVMRRMQLLGVYRDVELNQPNPTPNTVTSKIANTFGINLNNARPEDQNYTLYECYCEIDLENFEDTDGNGEVTGLPLPYRVTIDKDSRQILEIRRNWAEGDNEKAAKRVFVKYPFVPGLSFYDIGLLNILGNASAALTAAWRLALDSGMFANFPGFLYSKQGVGRQLSNEFRVPPGGGVGLDIGNTPIGNAVMPLPYKEMGASFSGFIAAVQQTLQRVGGTAEMNVGEGRQDAPVGTTVALIEQASKVMDAVHKRLHAAQAEEFQLLKDRFREDPEAFWRHNASPKFPRDRRRLLEALENTAIVPVADPNVPSSMHRHAKVAALMQLVTAFPALFDIPAVLDRVLRDMKFDNPQELMAKGQGAAPPDPRMISEQNKVMIEQNKAGLSQAKLQLDHLKLVADAAEREKDRKSKEDLAILQLANTQVIHPLSANIASRPALPVQALQANDLRPMGDGGRVEDYPPNDREIDRLAMLAASAAAAADRARETSRISDPRVADPFLAAMDRLPRPSQR